MNAKEAREKAIKVNPKTPELVRDTTVDNILSAVLKRIEDKCLNGEYTITLQFAQYCREIGKKLEELEYVVKYETNEYTGSKYIQINW